MTDQPQTVMMFTIATNGYDKIFADWLTTQRDYATRHDYRYVAITASPPEGISSANSSWLKIPLILRALERDYDWVFFVDADCRINADAPRIETVSASGKSVYVCRDFSDRINAGVIITKKDPMAVAFFRRLHRLADVPGILLPKQDRNLYEGGHFIWLGKNYPALSIIDQKWNNTTGCPMDEYIWHGGGRYLDKPRAATKPLTTTQATVRRFAEGPRYFLLRRLARYYEQLYDL